MCDLTCKLQRHLLRVQRKAAICSVHGKWCQRSFWYHFASGSNKFRSCAIFFSLSSGIELRFHLILRIIAASSTV